MRALDQILTVAQMRAAEQALIDAGETVGSLMERAGRGAADYVRRVAAGRAVTVLCGPGNNGGDGYVIARVLEAAGLAVQVVAPLEPRTRAAIAARQGWGGQASADARGAVFVDCLFGTGLTRPLEAPLAELAQRLAAQHDYRIAVDLPSGVDGDSGAVLGAGAPGYHLTIALGAWKPAHWLMPASALMGERRLVNIAIGAAPGAARLIARPQVPPPPPDAHKYTRGLLAVVSGQLPGAAMLAARAAMHAGAGYVKLLAQRRPDLAPDMLVVDQTPLAEALRDRRIGALLVGPGLGRSASARERLAAAMHADLPAIADADALVLLEPQLLAGRTAPLVLTPHAGEFAALCATFAIGEGPRSERAARLAETIGAIIVLKGADTLVAAPGEPLRIARPASSWLSTAGTGDVLAGIIASRLATGVAPDDAAAQGIWLHGEAARRCLPPFTPEALIQAVPAAYGACL